MTQTELFIERYKALENTVRNVYHLSESESIVSALECDPKFSKIRDDIIFCSRIRNFLQHNKKVDENFAITPNQAVISFVDTLIFKIENRPRCIDIAIRIKDVYAEEMAGLVKDAIRKMQEHSYTHIPLLRDGIVVGVFDENSVFCYLADKEIACIEDDLMFCNIDRYIQIDGRKMEDFIFVKPNEYVDDLEDKFENKFRKGKRVGIAFITKDGKRTSELIGIITAWDIVAARKQY